MLVCSVVLRPQLHTVAASIIEAGAAADFPSLGIVHKVLIDEPNNAREYFDAFAGSRLPEAANATATVDAASVRPASILEEISAAVSTQDANVNAVTLWATWDPSTVSSVTLSGGNLIATNIVKAPTNQGASVAAAYAKATGKYYFEATFISFTGGTNVGVGVGTTASTYSGLGNSATTGNNGLHGGAIWANGADTGITVGLYGDGQVAAIAVDLTNRTIWFKRLPTGNWNNSGTANPATNTGGVTIPAGSMVPFVTFGGGGGAANNVVAADFGASAFSGAVPSGFTPGWPIGTAATVAESATANATQDGTVVAAFTPATWDPATIASVTLSGGNRVVTSTSTSLDQGARVASSSGKTTGKFYFEITLTTLTGGGNTGPGVGTTTSTYTAMGNNATTGLEVFTNTGNIYSNGSLSGFSIGARATGQVISVAIDLTNRKGWFRVAPSADWNGTVAGDPATNVNGITIPAGTIVPFVTFNASGNVFTANFGATTFTGAVPSGFAVGWSV